MDILNTCFPIMQLDSIFFSSLLTGNEKSILLARLLQCNVFMFGIDKVKIFFLSHIGDCRVKLFAKSKIIKGSRWRRGKKSIFKVRELLYWCTHIVLELLVLYIDISDLSAYVTAELAHSQVNGFIMLFH